MLNKILVMIIALTMMGSGAAVSSAEELFDTGTAAIHQEKGMEFLRARNYEAAIQELEEATLYYPNAEAYYYLGYAYYLKGKKEEDGESRAKSLEYFDRAYELNPNFSPMALAPQDMQSGEQREEAVEQPAPQAEPPAALDQPQEQQPQPEQPQPQAPQEQQPVAEQGKPQQ